MKLVRSVLVAAALCGVAAPAAAIDAMYVFGDSLVDAGNAYLGTNGATAQKDLGYFKGRFSNGPEYTDLLNRRLFGSFTTPYLAGGNNYAVGGARAAGDRSLLGFNVPGLQTQLGIYLNSTGGAVDPNGLYVINFGNNDVSAILSGDTDGLSTAQYFAAYVGNIVGAVQYLSGHGATKILVAGVPNPDQAVGVALQAQLDLALDNLTLAPTTELYRFDFFSFFNGLRNDPTAYGLPATIDVNLDHPCIPGQLAFGFPPDCSQFFSFDGIHPTAPVHTALFVQVADLLGIASVPEPAVWLQLIVGFGLVGTVARRRKPVVA